MEILQIDDQFRLALFQRDLKHPWRIVPALEIDESAIPRPDVIRGFDPEWQHPRSLGYEVKDLQAVKEVGETLHKSVVRFRRDEAAIR